MATGTAPHSRRERAQRLAGRGRGPGGRRRRRPRWPRTAGRPGCGRRRRAAGPWSGGSRCAGHDRGLHEHLLRVQATAIDAGHRGEPAIRATAPAPGPPGPAPAAVRPGSGRPGRGPAPPVPRRRRVTTGYASRPGVGRQQQLPDAPGRQALAHLVEGMRGLAPERAARGPHQRPQVGPDPQRLTQRRGRSPARRCPRSSAAPRWPRAVPGPRRPSRRPRCSWMVTVRDLQRPASRRGAPGRRRDGRRCAPRSRPAASAR